MADADQPRAQPTAPLADGRRRMAAGHVILVVVVGLLLGALLNAEGLAQTAQRQPYGWGRTVAVAAVKPLQSVARATGLDRPRAFLRATVASRLRPGESGPEAGPGVVAAPSEGETDEPGPAGHDGPPDPGEEVADGADPVSDPRQPGQGAPTSTPGPRQPSSPGARDPVEPATAAAPPSREYSTDDPLRLWIGGDSLVEAFGQALSAQAAEAGAVTAIVDFHYSTGLSRPDYFAWPERVDEVVETEDPDVLVFIVGANDAQDIAVDGRVLHVGDPEWTAEYHSRAEDFARRATADGRHLYWVGQPIMQREAFDERMGRLNAAYAAATEVSERAHYVETRSLFTGPDGGYAAYLEDPSGRTERVRRNDGIHLTPAGGDRLAAMLLERVAADWPIPPKE